MKIIDITLPLYEDCPAWPGDKGFQHFVLSDMAAGDICTTSAFSGSAHLGTHMDAPRHFVRDGAGIDELDLSAMIGPALLVEVPDETMVTAEGLDDAIKKYAGGVWPQRLLIRTNNSLPGGALSKPDFDTSFCALSVPAAQQIVQAGVKLVGVDYFSVAPYAAGEAVHKVLLHAGVIPLEGLDLRHVRPGNYQLIALPLRLRGFDGAPARAVLVEE